MGGGIQDGVIGLDVLTFILGACSLKWNGEITLLKIFMKFPERHRKLSDLSCIEIALFYLPK